MLPKLDFAKHQSSLTTKSLYILSLFHADVQTNSNENGGIRLNHPFRAQKMRGVLSSGGGSERSAQHFSWYSAAQTLREPIMAWELGGHVQLFSVIVCPVNCKWKSSYHYDAIHGFCYLRKSAFVEIRWTVSALNHDRSGGNSENSGD